MTSHVGLSHVFVGLLSIFIGDDKSKQFKFVILPSPFEVGARIFSLNGINMHTPIQIVGREKNRLILGIFFKKIA